MYDEDFGSILVCAVRYCIGRRTYMPSIVAGYVGRKLKEIDTRALGVIKSDIISACKTKDGLGDEKIDKPVWVELLRKINEELERR